MSFSTNSIKGAQLGLKQILRIGCFLKLIPYTWDSKNQQLLPAAKIGQFLFQIHKFLTYSYLSHMWFRLIQFYINGEFSLLSFLWAVSNITTFAGFLILDYHPKDAMHFANRLLSNTLLETSKEQKGKNKKLTISVQI